MPSGYENSNFVFMGAVGNGGRPPVTTPFFEAESVVVAPDNEYKDGIINIANSGNASPIMFSDSSIRPGTHVINSSINFILDQANEILLILLLLMTPVILR